MTGIDTACPDVEDNWSYHAEWNQHERFWQEDFKQLAGLGFDLLRWGMPWSLVEPEPGKYRWDLLDPKIELAAKLGMEIVYPIVHFNYPKWILDRSRPSGVRHAALSYYLHERLPLYAAKLMYRYRFRYVIPIVEVSMDAFQRGITGNWQPHVKDRRIHENMWVNLVRAFRKCADVAREFGATVICSEPASELKTVLAFGDTVDVAGIDLYPHMHRKLSVIDYLRQWSERLHRPLCLSEFGTPESYDPEKRTDATGTFVTAGCDDRRVRMARVLRTALEQARREEIDILLGGWYPGTGNIGWGYALTRDCSDRDCDRAGLVDLARQPDGTLKRVLCKNLMEEVLGLREVYAEKLARPLSASVLQTVSVQA